MGPVLPVYPVGPVGPVNPCAPVQPVGPVMFVVVLIRPVKLSTVKRPDGNSFINIFPNGSTVSVFVTLSASLTIKPVVVNFLLRLTSVSALL